MRCPFCAQACISEDSLGYHLYENHRKKALLIYLGNRNEHHSPNLPKNFLVKEVVKAVASEKPMRMQSRTPGIFVTSRVRGS